MEVGDPTRRTNDEDDALVVSLSGGGGLALATELHGELEDAVGSGRRRVVVDVGYSPPLDLTVVGVLLAGLRRLNDADGRLVVFAPGTAPLVVGDNRVLERCFRVERSLPAAIAATAESRA
jgi:anti-anti-sigma regulatory factor